MPRFVEGGSLTVLGVEEDSSRGAKQDLLERVREVGHLNLFVSSARREQCRLVGEVGQVGADHPGRSRGQRIEVDIVCEGHRASVDFQNLYASLAVGSL